MEYVTWESIPLEAMSDVITRRIITGEKAMVAQVFFKKGAVVPLHQHESEQITFMLDGADRHASGIGRHRQPAWAVRGQGSRSAAAVDRIASRYRTECRRLRWHSRCCAGARAARKVARPAVPVWRRTDRFLGRGRCP